MNVLFAYHTINNTHDEEHFIRNSCGSCDNSAPLSIACPGRDGVILLLSIDMVGRMMDAE